MKTINILILFIFLQQSYIIGQPDITWLRTYGGSQTDVAVSLCKTFDGGYIFTGTTASSDGDVSANNGERDIWVLKVTSQGEMEWEKCFGGTDWDHASKVIVLSDSTYLVAGSVKSTNGDVIGNHGDYDGWLFKLDNSGNMLWQKCFGGEGTEYIYDIKQTIDGGYIMVGTNSSEYINGVATGNHGSLDYWIVKLDSLGNYDWQKTYGGYHEDGPRQVLIEDDGGYIVAGTTWSNDGDITGFQGGMDFWILKLNAFGDIEWKKCYGGSGIDSGSSIISINNSGWIIAGNTDSDDGDVTGGHGDDDIWVIKIDETGILEWQKCFGGSLSDLAVRIQETLDGDFIIVGRTSSYDGDVSGMHGYYDIWVFKMNNLNEIIWQKCIGGIFGETGMDLVENENNVFTIIGSSSSYDGDMSYNHGWEDLCIFNLDETVGITTQESMVYIYPNPIVNKGINIDCSIIKPTRLRLFDLNGRMLLDKKLNQKSTYIDLESISNGIYLIQVFCGENLIQQQKVVKRSY